MVGESQHIWSIKSEKLHKAYPGVNAVKSLDFQVASGVVHGFLGPNGAGKSTTIRMICGLLRPTSGRVLVEGFDPVENPLEVKRKLGLLPETPPLYKEMTVLEFLKFTAELHGVKKSQLKEALDKVIQQTNLTHVAHRLVGNLSKGYRQRVGIAQALVHDPAVIILDEPTSGLDPESVVEIRNLIKKLKHNKTVLFSSHLLHEVEEICDTLSIISHGELLAHGTMNEVLQRYNSEATLEIETLLFDDSQMTAIKNLSMISFVEKNDFDHLSRLKIQLNTKAEVRNELIKSLVSMGINLLSVELKKPELEEIFLKVTQKRPQI
jgi:ABC-2 type transport system ATP-binding protein